MLHENQAIDSLWTLYVCSFYEKGVIMSILTLNNITQQFGDKILYEGVDPQLNAGEHLGLIGQNGAGKSTLIKIITGEILAR